ncbi:MAG: isocitrate dehydrogenase (NAD(+)) [Acidobacteria bacterium]|nr:isocitrate dehydrogenase (NAD(+)) [Acidobacteriota bacterium]
MRHRRFFMHRVTLIRGEGIGPEVAAAACRIVEAAGVKIEWEPVAAPRLPERREDHYLHSEWVESIRRNRVALKGPITTPIAEGPPSLNVALRRALDLYANLRPVKSIAGVRSRFQDIDLVVVRENTEDLYSGLEHVVVPGVVESLKIITERASTRIARFAFEYARRHQRRKICAVHKANIMKLSDGLFLTCIRKVAQDYPDIGYSELIVDNTCMQLVLRPEDFDVLLLENLYGDIVSDLCAGLVGGLGLVPGANLGDEAAVFEAVHGTAPDIAGKNLANPTALTLSAALMLEHLGEVEAATRIRGGLADVYQQGKTLTRDLGGTATTTEFGDAVIQALETPAAQRRVSA